MGKDVCIGGEAMKKNILILLTSSLFCLVYVSFSIVPPLMGDAFEYYSAAMSILNFSVYSSQSHSAFQFSRPPFFPLVLAAIGGNRIADWILQSIMVGVMSVVIYHIVPIKKNIAPIVVTLWCVPYVALGMHSDILSGLMMSLSILIASRNDKSKSIGLYTCASFLSHRAAMLYAVVPFLKTRSKLLFLVVFAVPVIVWSSYVYYYSGVFWVSTLDSSITLSYGTMTGIKVGGDQGRHSQAQVEESLRIMKLMEGKTDKERISYTRTLVKEQWSNTSLLDAMLYVPTSYTYQLFSSNDEFFKYIGLNIDRKYTRLIYGSIGLLMAIGIGISIVKRIEPVMVLGYFMVAGICILNGSYTSSRNLIVAMPSVALFFCVGYDFLESKIIKLVNMGRFLWMG